MCALPFRWAMIPFEFAERRHASATDEARNGGMTAVDVVEPDFDEGDAGVEGNRVRHEAPHPGPGAVGADHEIEVAAFSVCEVEPDAPVGNRARITEDISPSHRFRRKRFGQNPPKLRAIDFGSVAAGAARLVEQDLPGLVENPHALILVASDDLERRVEAGLPYRGLAAACMKIERSPLRTLESVCVTFKDCRRDPSRVKDPRQRKAAGTAADDSDARG